MKFGLSENTIDKINNLFVKYPQIEEVILYGSRAKGNYKNGSDIDIVLKGKNMDQSFLYKLANEIDDLMLPYSFDISLYDSITNKELLDHINRVGKVFFNRSLITN